MSSPMMTRIFGGAESAVWAHTLVADASNATAHSQDAVEISIV